MSEIEHLIKKLGIEIPKPPLPVGNYAAYTKSNSLIYISGQLPLNSEGTLIVGKVGLDLTIEQGKEAARLCILNCIGQLKSAVLNLDTIKKCIKINGYINCTKDFIEHPKLLNAASDIIVKIFGNKGIHARAVIGVESLPLGAAVEIEAIFEIDG